jgi:hypothetical protein
MTSEQTQFLYSNGLAVLVLVALGLFGWRAGWPFIKDQILAMQESFRQDMADRKAEIASLIANNESQRTAHLANERQSRADYLQSLENIRLKQDAMVSGELRDLRTAIMENTKTMHDYMANMQEWDKTTDRRRKKPNGGNSG